MSFFNEIDNLFFKASPLDNPKAPNAKGLLSCIHLGSLKFNVLWENGQVHSIN